MELKDTDSLVKKKFRAHQSVKKRILIVFPDLKGPVNIDFIEKYSKEKLLSIANYLGKIYLIYLITLVYINTGYGSIFLLV